MAQQRNLFQDTIAALRPKQVRLASQAGEKGHVMSGQPGSRVRRIEMRGTTIR